MRAAAGVVFVLMLAGAGCVDIALPPVGGGLRVCSAEMRTGFLRTEPGAERPDLWIAFVDVGHGDATWLRTPGTVGVDAAEILIDAGDDGLPEAPHVPDGGAAVLDLMARAGFAPGHPLDVLAITHPDKDHHGGTAAVLAHHPARVFLDPGRGAGGPTWTRAQQAARSAGATRWVAPTDGLDGGGRWSTGRWGRELTVRLLAADPDARTDNGASLVFEVLFRGRRVLLMGDAGAEVEARLGPTLGPVDILRTGHHGGVDTSTVPFLDRVLAPGAFAVISAGERAGLPHRGVVQRLAERVGDRLLRTDRGDEGASRRAAAGDDHVVARIAGADGAVEVCVLDPDVDRAHP